MEVMMRKRLAILAIPVILAGCVQPTTGDMLAASQTCQAAGIPPQIPMHAVCVDKLVEDNEDRYAQIGIVTAVAGAVLSVISVGFTIGVGAGVSSTY